MIQITREGQDSGRGRDGGGGGGGATSGRQIILILNTEPLVLKKDQMTHIINSLTLPFWSYFCNKYFHIRHNYYRLLWYSTITTSYCQCSSSWIISFTSRNPDHCHPLIMVEIWIPPSPSLVNDLRTSQLHLSGTTSLRQSGVLDCHFLGSSICVVGVDEDVRFRVSINLGYPRVDYVRYLQKSEGPVSCPTFTLPVTWTSPFVFDTTYGHTRHSNGTS